MKKYAFLLFAIMCSCNNDNLKDPIQTCVVTPKPGRTTDSAKIAVPAMLYKSATTVSDSRVVSLGLEKFISRDFPNAQMVADSALHIASVLISSNEFKSVFNKLDFTCKNYGYYCKVNCKNCKDRFAGSIALDSVFRQKDVKLKLFLNDCGNEYGHATHNVFEIYSCQSVVFYDERELTPAYCYAYHIAHEYMHIVGFFHTDHVDDVAEKTGLGRMGDPT